MRLERLSLTNICQHESLEWEFSNGLIGIMGCNGAGKSNALNLGCYAGLTNDYSRHPQGKAGYVRQQAGPKERSEIIVDFSHDGESFRLIRGLQAPTQHVMQFISAGRKQLTKANDIQKELEEVLGISKRLIDEYLFVDQYSLYSFLSAVPADRAKAFAHLCGTTKAEQIWELLKTQSNEDAGLVHDNSENLDEVRAKAGVCKKEIRTKRKRLELVEQQLLSDDEEEELTASFAAKEEYDSLVSEVDLLEETESRRKEQAKEIRSRWKAAKHRLEHTQGASCGDEARLEEVLTELANLREDDERYKKKVQFQKKLVEEEEELEELNATKPEDPGFDLEALHGMRDALIYEISDKEKLLENFKQGIKVCPVCKTPTDSPDLQQRIESAKKTLPKQIDEAAQLDEQISQQQEYERDIVNFRRQLTALNKSIDNLKNWIEPYSEVKQASKKKRGKLQRERDQIYARKETIEKLRDEERKTSDAFNAARSRHKAVKARLKDASEKLKQYAAVGDDQVQEARDRLAEHKAALKESMSLRADVRHQESLLESYEELIERLQETSTRAKRARVWLRTLQQVRDEVMHRDKLPKVVHLNYLRSMEREINDTLQLFDSPFTISVSEDVGFTAEFADGTRMPAAGLSGGQKVMLAMAYRLTVNSLFPKQVGMMVLDEPTDGLDQENRDLASQVFIKLGEVARSRGHQVIVITHDGALRRAFDQRFTLERAI